MLTQEDKQHLQWIHDRIVNVYKESENVDFLWALRKIIKKIDTGTKPPTEVYYEKVEDTVFDLKDEFLRGELYYLPNVPDNYKVIETEPVLCNCAANKRVYRRVEKEVDWKDDVNNFLNSPLTEFDFDKAIIGDFTPKYLMDTYPDKFLEMCRIPLRVKMSLHNEPKSKPEVEGLLLHGLKVGRPSQLSDCFILGMRWEQTLKFGELEKATKSLKSAGFTDEGGELWKPPVNKEAGKWVIRALDAEDKVEDLVRSNKELVDALYKSKVYLAGVRRLTTIQINEYFEDLDKLISDNEFKEIE